MLKSSPETESSSEAAKPTKVETRSTANTEAKVGNADSPANAVGKTHERPLKQAEEDFPKLAMEAVSKNLLEAMQERQTKRTEERIARLKEKLGLDAAQEAKLRDFFKQQEAASIVSGENGSIRMSKPGNGASLDDFLKDLLTDPQEESYAQLKETERNQRIEARTLREMASLTQSVDLRPDQRDAAYAILQEQAKSDAESGAPMAMIAGALMPPPGLEEGAAVDSVVSFKVAGGAGGDDGAAMDSLRQQQQAQIDEKVNRMSGVLDEKQLAQYRASLEQGSMVLPR